MMYLLHRHRRKTIESFWWDENSCMWYLDLGIHAMNCHWSEHLISGMSAYNTGYTVNLKEKYSEVQLNETVNGSIMNACSSSSDVTISCSRATNFDLCMKLMAVTVSSLSCSLGFFRSCAKDLWHLEGAKVTTYVELLNLHNEIPNRKTLDQPWKHWTTSN